jgi:hypothetical protein
MAAVVLGKCGIGGGASAGSATSQPIMGVRITSSSDERHRPSSPPAAAPATREAHQRGLRESGNVRPGPDGVAGCDRTGHRDLEEAPSLTEEQQRDIFYNNAARFLRLRGEEIRHHGR